MSAPRSGKNGRPSRPEVRAQKRALLLHLAAGASLADARELAGMSPLRLLQLLNDPAELRAIYVLMRQARLDLEDAA